MKSGKPTMPSFPPVEKNRASSEDGRKNLQQKEQSQSQSQTLTPQFDQFGEDDEADFLSDGVGEIHGSLDDGEHDSLYVFCSWKKNTAAKHSANSTSTNSRDNE